ncbi:hypothetical protein CgunFtcFv8_017317 [Champsocephalus gunnari]|uniref:Uncharacterized protein n=1 Tax=Champsocephalus gunnari TaxID=52237 RepID=A0AAN8HRA1_CHAGU|nr:hypothetical protein CgunFtcFv8_017317 [Champsocephalus gunnari]
MFLACDASEAGDFWAMTSRLNPPHPEAGLTNVLSPSQAVPVCIPAGMGNIHHGRFSLECCPVLSSSFFTQAEKQNPI